MSFREIVHEWIIIYDIDKNDVLAGLSLGKIMKQKAKKVNRYGKEGR